MPLIAKENAQRESRIAYRRVGRLNRHLGSQSRESSETPTRTIGIVIFADRAAYRGRTARFSQHVITAGVGRVTLIGARVRIRPGLVRTVERFDVSRPMDDSHRLPYLAGRRSVVIIFLGLAAPLVDDLSAPRHGHLLLRHDGRLYAQGCLESYRGPLQAFPVSRYHGGSLSSSTHTDSTSSLHAWEDFRYDFRGLEYRLIDVNGCRLVWRWVERKRASGSCDWDIQDFSRFNGNV